MSILHEGGICKFCLIPGIITFNCEKMLILLCCHFKKSNIIITLLVLVNYVLSILFFEKLSPKNNLEFHILEVIPTLVFLT